MELKTLLQIDDEYKSSTKLVWSGAEGLCILLRRLAYPNRLCDLVPMFGQHCTELSVIINVMLNELHTQTYRLQSVTQPWVHHEEFAESVANKGSALTNVWGFIDGTQG